MALAVALRRTWSDGDDPARTVPGDEIVSTVRRQDAGEAELLELDTSVDSKEAGRSPAGAARESGPELDWQWLLAHRCSKPGAVPTEEQHWLERYVRLDRGRARLRADPSAAQALDALALAIETRLDARGEFVIGKEAASASRPDVLLRSGPRAYPIRRGEFPDFDELHAFWRQGSRQRVPAALLRRVEAEVEAALSQARARFPDALLR